MSIKPNWDNRIKEGKIQIGKRPAKKSEVLSEISECMKKKHIVGDIVQVNPKEEKINYKKIMMDHKTNGEGHVIWIQFVKSGHVAVVGAGKDIGFPTTRNKGTWSFLKRLEDGSKNVEWDESQVIVIPIRGLDEKSNGLKNVNNVLNCRNGVEQCIGDYLIQQKIPILNYYSHKNYSKKFWEQCEEKNYNIT